MSKWRIINIIPNIKVNLSIGNKYIAIAPYDDPRIQELISEFPLYNVAFNGFIDDHNRKIYPPALIVSDEIPDSSLKVETIVAFRNIVAISSICLGWSHLNPYNVFAPLYSDTFDFYPIKFGIDGSFVTHTPATTALRSSKSPLIATTFRGVPVMNIVQTSLDKDIFAPLIEVWIKLFIHPRKNTYNLVMLFRSLEAVYRALSMPRKNEATINDFGSLTGEWISAFEILAHPYKKNVRIEHVLSLLSDYPHKNTIMFGKRYKDKVAGKKRQLNLLEKLYVKLYSVRHDFLHGNKISQKILKILKNEGLHNNVFYISAPLYRIALYAFLFNMKVLKVKKINNATEYQFSFDCFTNYNYEKFFEQIIHPEIDEEDEG